MGEVQIPYVHVHVGLDEVELASSALWDLGALGIEERDPTTIEHGTGAHPVTLRAAFASQAQARAALAELCLRYEADLQQITEEDWASTWKAGLRPIAIGRRLYLCPSWISPSPDAEQVVVTMDPENAFGSGTHETTQLVLRELDRRVSGGERVLDVGCGSGVLAIAALKLGAASAVATDVDADALVVSSNNAVRNGVASELEVADRLPSTTEPLYDVVLANIHAPVLKELAQSLQRLLAPSGTLVLSGILEGEWRGVAEAYALPVMLTTRQGQWVCLTMGAGAR